MRHQLQTQSSLSEISLEIEFGGGAYLLACILVYPAIELGSLRVDNCGSGGQPLGADQRAQAEDHEQRRC